MIEKTSFVQVLGDRIASIEVVAGRAAGAKVMLSAGTFIIGRESDADLQLGDEPGVSRVHAKIVAERDRYRLVDNESRNGTLLNGNPIRSEVLNDGDVIDIAQCRIVFRQMGGPPRPTTSPPPPPSLANMPTPAIAVSAAAPPPPAAGASFAPPPPTTPLPPATPARRDAPGRRIVAMTFGATVVVLGLGAAVAVVALQNPGRRTTTTSPSPSSSSSSTTPTTASSSTTTTGATATTAAATATPATPATPTTPSATPANDAPFVEVTSENHAEVLRSAHRGRVQAIPAAIGARLKAGDVIVVLAEEAGNAADIATRRESISALEGIAEGNEAASRQLAVEKAELKALLSKAPQKKLVAPVAGALAALDVKVGESVRQAQVIGRIQGDDVVVRARVAADVAAGVSAGAACELKTKSGAMAKGTLKEKVDRGGGQFELVVDAGQSTDVTGLRCLPSP